MKELTLHQQLRVEFAKAALQGILAEGKRFNPEDIWLMANEMLNAGERLEVIPQRPYVKLPCGCEDDTRHHCVTKTGGDSC
ncbi:hypothetical protein BKM35_22070 [Salmonella enterica]|nr:hypothetical protein [Salmonella enterica]